MTEPTMAEKFWESFFRMCRLEFHNVSFTTLILCCLVVVIAVHLCCYVYVRVTEKQIGLGTEISLILSICYLLFIAQVTIFSRPAGSQPKVFDTKFLWIDDKMDQNMTNLLNIFLFIPFGALLANLMSNAKTGKTLLMSCCYCFLVSLCIECTQYMTGRGYFEVDDLQANVLGGLIGSLFVVICVALGKKCRAEKEK